MSFDFPVTYSQHQDSIDILHLLSFGRRVNIFRNLQRDIGMNTKRGESMFLYLVQHGDAKREDEDPERRLTEKGMADVGKAAQFLKNKNLSPSKVFHSNKTRAAQTGKIFADYLKPAQGVSEAGNLTPMDDPKIWADRIEGMQEDIMLVGHLPFMAKLANLLLCSEREKPLIDFKMGGVVCLARSEDTRWIVEWIITPEMI